MTHYGNLNPLTFLSLHKILQINIIQIYILTIKNLSNIVNIFNGQHDGKTTIFSSLACSFRLKRKNLTDLWSKPHIVNKGVFHFNFIYSTLSVW